MSKTCYDLFTWVGRAVPWPAAIANPRVRVRIDRDGAHRVTRPTTTPSQRVAGPTEEDQTRIARIDSNSLERHLSTLMLSRGEGENLSLACVVRRVNVLIKISILKLRGGFSSKVPLPSLPLFHEREERAGTGGA